MALDRRVQHRGTAVGKHAAGDQELTANPAVPDVLAEPHPRPRGTRCRGHHLDSFQCIFDPRACQRPCAGECGHHEPADVVAVNREEVLRAAAVHLLETIQECLPGLITFVVLIQPHPAGKLPTPPRISSGEFEGSRRVTRWHPTDVGKCRIHPDDSQAESDMHDRIGFRSRQFGHRGVFVSLNLRNGDLGHDPQSCVSAGVTSAS